MFTSAKALLLIARYFRRIAIALESIHRLYELELGQQNIIITTPGLRDEVEITYGTHAAPAMDPRTPAEFLDPDDADDPNPFLD